MLAAARAGDVVAQFNVGVMYSTGAAVAQGVAQSYSSAHQWFSRCAAHATPPREVWAELAQQYLHGDGVRKDEAEAVRLFRVGAAAGDARAQRGLGKCVAQGIGVPVADFDEAFKLYSASAAQGYPPAMLSLGVCYANGRGVVRDVPRAVALYKRALAHPDAGPRLAAAVANNLGITYWGGADGVPRDAALGVRYLRQAAALGDEDATRYMHARGIPMLAEATFPAPG